MINLDSNSTYGKWFQFWYQDHYTSGLPESTCSFFWKGIFSLVLCIFYPLGFAFLYAVVSIGLGKSISRDIPRVIVACMGVLPVMFLVPLLLEGKLQEVGLIIVGGYVSLVVVNFLNRLWNNREVRKRISVDSEAVNPITEAIKSVASKTCRKINWKEDE